MAPPKVRRAGMLMVPIGSVAELSPSCCSGTGCDSVDGRRAALFSSLRGGGAPGGGGGGGVDGGCG